MAHANYIDPSLKNTEAMPVMDQANVAQQHRKPHEDFDNSPNQPTDPHKSKSLTTNGHASQQDVKKEKAKQQ